MVQALLNRGIGSILLRIKPGFPIIRMSASWACSNCTFINPQSQKSRCEICLSDKTRSSSSLSTSTTTASASENKWSCSACTYLNPYSNTVCEICSTRASASILSTLALDEDELRESHVGSFIGNVFMPLKSCTSDKQVSVVESTACGSESKTLIWPVPYRAEKKCVDKNQRKIDLGKEGPALKPCSNKRKERDDGGLDHGGSSGFISINPATKCVLDATTSSARHSLSDSKTWKIMTYNVWFREDLEMYNRMKALGNLIQLHSPDVICLQEVTPSFYEIFQKTNWWRSYRCTIPDESSFPGSYFCLQLSKLPVKSCICRPFPNSIMGRELIVTEIDLEPENNNTLAIATSHLESPCPAPPKWDQMFSKERVVQAKEAITFLDKYKNVIFCGDMNWNDKLDGPFPLSNGWIDAWTEMKPGQDGFTYDTKTNKMLSGNRTLQVRLDRFVCKMKDLRAVEIEMIGRDEIPELRYVKEKRVKGVVKEMELPVLPSDHYGLVLTIGTLDGSSGKNKQ